MTTIANENVTTDVKASEFYVKPSVLIRALRIAELCASKDDTLPILAGVALTVTAKGTLVAQSTDRYRLVRARIETADDQPVDLDEIKTRPAIVPLAAVKTLLTWLKPQVKELGAWGHVHVRIISGHYNSERLEIDTPLGDKYVVSQLTEGEYPKIGGILPDDGPVDDHADYTALNPTYLEFFAKIGKLGCERNTPMELIMGKTAAKPVVFRGRDENGIVFDGLQMPVRLPQGIGSYETL